jgi:ribosomal protein L11 methylase PrmA
MRPETEGGSFRDPAGFIFTNKGAVYRQINKTGREDYDQLMSSGLYDDLVKKQLLVPHKEVTSLKDFSSDSKRYKIIKPEKVPFISYPYEWTFVQLREAARLTLSVMQVALAHGMILKDASAYNIQFIGTRPIFIDTLSFAKYETGKQWEGYKQFCEHFVAPLALGHYATPDVLRLLRANIDGIPLDLTVKLLPAKARLNGGLFAHLYIHNSSQRRHQSGGQEEAKKAKGRKMTPLAMQGLMSSLERTVNRLRPANVKTEWGEYYTFTNYSDAAFKAKRKIVSDLVGSLPNKPKMVWDVGANNGEFSEVGVEHGAYTIAFDIDEKAVARNFMSKRDDSIKNGMLPLVQDLTNPSPALGWAHEERDSLIGRGPADVVFVLALIHHLSIGNNVPFDRVADFLSKIGKHVIIEFVPKGDSKVDHLLASRKDIFDTYDTEHFEAAFAQYFKLVTKKPVKGSKRTIYLYKTK